LPPTQSLTWPNGDKQEIDVADAGESLMDDMTEDQLIELLTLQRGVAQRKPS
jgi:hypothetical protein